MWKVSRCFLSTSYVETNKADRINGLCVREWEDRLKIGIPGRGFHRNSEQGQNFGVCSEDEKEEAG
jgi:hypothetical protein